MAARPKQSSAKKPVAIIMGSQSDWATMQHAAQMLDQLKVGYDALIVSAHRTPGRLYAFAKSAHRKHRIVIAGAGGAAHLPGMAAAMTTLPVLGVPMNVTALEGKDSLLSIVQMPAGIPVGTLAIGKPGAINAALLAAAILALDDTALAKRLAALRKAQTAGVAKRPKAVDETGRPKAVSETKRPKAADETGRPKAVSETKRPKAVSETKRPK